MGRRSVIGTTDTRSRNTLHRGRRRRPHVPARPDQRPAGPRGAADGRRRHRRAVGVRPLVVKTRGRRQTHVDWTSLSRKHEIERDDDLNVVTIFGGKLTDCLNVGEEVADADRAARGPAREGSRELVRRTGQGDAHGVLPAGQADEARPPAHEARHRAAHRIGSGAGTAGGRSTCSRRSVPTRRWGRTSWGRPTICAPSCTRGRARDDREARRLHAAAVEDRPGRARR